MKKALHHPRRGDPRELRGDMFTTTNGHHTVTASEMRATTTPPSTRKRRSTQVHATTHAGDGISGVWNEPQHRVARNSRVNHNMCETSAC